MRLRVKLSRRVIGGAIVCLSAFGSAHIGAAQQTPGVQRVSKDWKQARAGDIEVMGPVSDGDIRSALEQIRSFRELFAGLLPNLKVTSANPTRVVVFPNSSALRRFAPRDTRGRLQNLGGYFASTADVNIIAIGGPDRELIYHEFAHYLLRHNLHSQPTWVNEGLAEFYSTFDVDDKKGTVVIGRPPPSRLRTLRTAQYLPVKKVVDASPDEMSRLRQGPESIAMFYAESWGLVHYLLLGREPKTPGAFGRVLASVEKGGSHTQALQKEFGVDLERLDAEFKGYLRRGVFPAIAIDIKASPAASIAVQPMAEAEARYVQGDLLVRNGSIDEAAEELGAALVLDPSHVGARIDSAQILRERGNPGAAIDALKAIAAEAPTHFAAAYYLAAALASEWRHDEAIAMYSRAVELNAGSADAWMGLSVTALALGRTVQANAAMTQAMRREGGSDMYRSRAYAALAVGADAIAAADARRYLELAGWSTETAVYTAFVGAIGHLRLQQVEQARELLSAAREASSSAPWTMLVAEFLDARVTPEAFLAKAKSDGEKTEAHAYVGFRAEIEGRKDEAITHFQWVIDKGAKNYFEFRMARSALKRLQR